MYIEPSTLNHKSGFPIPQKDYYKVYVRSITFNQVPYIEDCLNGVAIQETNFPFVHHVIDDASTDGEQDVIKAWMDKNCDMEHAEYYDNDICTITLVKNKKNPNCTLAAYFLKKNMYGNPKKRELFTPWREVCPYEALCEGDDYWIDPKKLQKQMDWLDGHEDCSICCLRVQKIHADGSIIPDATIPPTSFPADQKITLELFCKEQYLYRHWMLHTSNYFFRTSMNKIYIERMKREFKDFPFGDMPLVLTCLMENDGYCFSEIGGYYRVMSGGYNSMMACHPEIHRRNDYKLFSALRSFDNVTNGRYHEYIDHYILQGMYDLDFGSMAIFKWKYRSKITWRHAIYAILNTISPNICEKYLSRFMHNKK